MIISLPSEHSLRGFAPVYLDGFGFVVARFGLFLQELQAGNTHSQLSFMVLRTNELQVWFLSEHLVELNDPSKVVLRQTASSIGP